MFDRMKLAALAAVAAMRRGWSYLLTKLNAIGALFLLYVMEHPNAPAEFVLIFPVAMQPLVKLALPLAWFLVVQFAKRRAVAHGK